MSTQQIWRRRLCRRTNCLARNFYEVSVSYRCNLGLWNEQYGTATVGLQDFSGTTPACIGTNSHIIRMVPTLVTFDDLNLWNLLMPSIMTNIQRIGASRIFVEFVHHHSATQDVSWRIMMIHDVSWWFYVQCYVFLCHPGPASDFRRTRGSRLERQNTGGALAGLGSLQRNATEKWRKTRNIYCNWNQLNLWNVCEVKEAKTRKTFFVLRRTCNFHAVSMQFP